MKSGGMGFFFFFFNGAASSFSAFFFKLSKMPYITFFWEQTTRRYLGRNLECVWRSCGRQPPPPPSAPPGSRGYSVRPPRAPAPFPHRRTGCGAAAGAGEEEAPTKQWTRPGKAKEAQWGPLPRAGERSGGSPSVPKRIRSQAAAWAGGYCPV